MDAIEQLFAEVYANPGDDQVRRVLADALLAIGDPRGELILFQLEPDKDYHRRAMRLIQAHGLTWLGPLRGSVIPLGYERGFLAQVQILSGARMIDWDLPVWSTVHTIDFDNLDDDALLDVRITPAMKSLAVLRGLTGARVVILKKRNSIAGLKIMIEAPPTPVPDEDDNYDPVAE